MTKPPGVSDKDVKDMSPSFKGQYGDRWKKVMYATLWKRHGQQEDHRLEMINYIWENVHPSRKVEETQSILISLPEGRQARPLIEMSDDELEHHYMNIRVSEGSNFLKAHEREGFEAFKSGKAHADNPHPKGSQKAYHWTSGHKLGAVMKSRKMFKEDINEGEHEERTKAYQKDKSFSMKPRGDDHAMVGNDSGYVYKTHSSKTLMRQHVADHNNLKNPPKSKMVIDKNLKPEIGPKKKPGEAALDKAIAHLMPKKPLPLGKVAVKEDAIDDQLAKHGLSRHSVDSINKSKGLFDLSKFKRPRPQSSKAVQKEDKSE
jgi:hypothetical protein